MAMRRKRVFDKVFDATTSKATPTPNATPQTGFDSGPFATASSFNSNDSNEADKNAHLVIRRERAWHAATSFIQDVFRYIGSSEWSQHADPFHAFEKDMRLLLSNTPEEEIRYLVRDETAATMWKPDSLSQWYMAQAIKQFYDIFAKVLTDTRDDFWTTIERLEKIERLYLQPFFLVIVQQVSKSDGVYESFSNQFRATVLSLLPRMPSLEQLSKNLLEIELQHFRLRSEAGTDRSPPVRRSPTELISSLYGLLTRIGLRNYAERIFAVSILDLIKHYIRATYASKWETTQVSNFRALEDWVLGSLVPFMQGKVSTVNPVLLTSCAKIELGNLRLEELFPLVVDWDDSHRGAVDDIRSCSAGTPEDRAKLIKTFSKVLKDRLLHQGASTTEILQAYINIIRVFALLDPRGALLQKVDRPIRQYLRFRDDTIAIIVKSLLADLDTPAQSDDILVELAMELQRSTPSAGPDPDNASNFDDMEWLPDPIDAGPDFQHSKSVDIIGAFVSIFESKDIFVSKFRGILANRLLERTGTFEKETRVLELLKSRFGDSALQNCEVMLRDVIESRRIDASVRRDRNLTGGKGGDIEMSTKILSKRFWPDHYDEEYSLPTPIAELQASYAAGFERHKIGQKLTYLPALGQAVVQLDFSDRTITETVLTWQATVIYAFHSDSGVPAAKTIDALAEELSMDRSHVANAVSLWVGRLVLIESSPGLYTVLDPLPSSSQPSTQGTTITSVTQSASSPSKLSSALTSAAAAASASANAGNMMSAVRTEADIKAGKMDVIWQYIVGMLTNQGAMPLQRIAMMLGFVVEGGCPFNEGEIKEFLGEKIAEGKVEIAGGNYRLVK